MILSVAVLAGLLAGLARSSISKQEYQVPSLRYAWLVVIAFIPQWVSFYRSGNGLEIPNDWVPLILVGSQVILMVFVWVNYKQPGFWLLGLGLALNILVILLNGGMMPISPDTVRVLYPNLPESQWSIGQRLGHGKDVVLPEAATRLVFLSDRFLTPDWFPYSVAFSIGDVLIAAGVIWLLWSLGGHQKKLEQATL